MHQIINLYQPVIRQQPSLLAATSILSILAAAATLLFACYVYGQTIVNRLENTSSELSLNHSRLNAQLEAHALINTPPHDESTALHSSELEHQVSIRNSLVQQIDNLTSDTSSGFAAVFETLAKRRLPGLWLTGIQLTSGGSIEITGKAVDPTLVPRYLDIISREKSLNSLKSGTVNLERSESKQAEIDFELSYLPPETLQ